MGHPSFRRPNHDLFGHDPKQRGHPGTVASARIQLAITIAPSLNHPPFLPIFSLLCYSSTANLNFDRFRPLISPLVFLSASVPWMVDLGAHSTTTNAIVLGLPGPRASSLLAACHSWRVERVRVSTASSQHCLSPSSFEFRVLTVAYNHNEKRYRLLKSLKQASKRSSCSRVLCR